MGYCPNCKNKYVCPCNSCIDRNKEAIPWLIIDDVIGVLACPHCRLQNSDDKWMDIFASQMEEHEKK